MPVGAPSTQKIIDAWFSITDDWIVRRNKIHDTRQWEVVHDWGGDLISDDTQKLLARFDTKLAADQYAADRERLARAGAVQAMIASQLVTSQKIGKGDDCPTCGRVA
jgi:hypothetical protein